jgi:hypothetical protein
METQSVVICGCVIVKVVLHSKAYAWVILFVCLILWRGNVRIEFFCRIVIPNLVVRKTKSTNLAVSFLDFSKIQHIGAQRIGNIGLSANYSNLCSELFRPIEVELFHAMPRSVPV